MGNVIWVFGGLEVTLIVDGSTSFMQAYHSQTSLICLAVQLSLWFWILLSHWNHQLFQVPLEHKSWRAECCRTGSMHTMSNPKQGGFYGDLRCWRENLDSPEHQKVQLLYHVPYRMSSRFYSHWSLGESGQDTIAKLKHVETTRHDQNESLPRPIKTMAMRHVSKNYSNCGYKP